MASRRNFSRTWGDIARYSSSMPHSRLGSSHARAGIVTSKVSVKCRTAVKPKASRRCAPQRGASFASFEANDRRRRVADSLGPGLRTLYFSNTGWNLSEDPSSPESPSPQWTNRPPGTRTLRHSRSAVGTSHGVSG